MPWLMVIDARQNRDTLADKRKRMPCSRAVLVYEHVKGMNELRRWEAVKSHFGEREISGVAEWLLVFALSQSPDELSPKSGVRVRERIERGNGRS